MERPTTLEKKMNKDTLISLLAVTFVLGLLIVPPIYRARQQKEGVSLADKTEDFVEQAEKTVKSREAEYKALSVQMLVLKEKKATLEEKLKAIEVQTIETGELITRAKEAQQENRKGLITLKEINELKSSQENIRKSVDDLKMIMEEVWDLLES